MGLNREQLEGGTVMDCQSGKITLIIFVLVLLAFTPNLLGCVDGVERQTVTESLFLTNTPTPTVAPTITSAPTPSCLSDLPPSPVVVVLRGRFETLPPIPLEEFSNPKAWNNAKRLVCDSSFFASEEQGGYNVWTLLLNSGELVDTDEIPHFIALLPGGEPTLIWDLLDKTVGEYIKEYGEPSFLSEFHPEEGEVLNVYWFGPVFIMAEELDTPCIGIGGWVSHLQ